MDQADLAEVIGCSHPAQDHWLPVLQSGHLNGARDENVERVGLVSFANDDCVRSDPELNAAVRDLVKRAAAGRVQEAEATQRCEAWFECRDQVFLPAVEAMQTREQQQLERDRDDCGHNERGLVPGRRQQYGRRHRTEARPR